eukprot:3683531-Alexandrium_andersonii.AAC.1
MLDVSRPCLGLPKCIQMCGLATLWSITGVALIAQACHAFEGVCVGGGEGSQRTPAKTCPLWAKWA